MKGILLTTLGALTIAGGFAQSIQKTCYRGAFAPAPAAMWTDGWTEWDPQNKSYPAPTMTVSSDITSTTIWATGQTVLLTAPIYVKQNSVLTIQPGVTVLGDKSATGAALIITKGSQLIANGTVTAPIVFTSNQAPGLRNVGDWGGIILLGKATNNNSNGVGTIEGLPISGDTEYGGGASPDDNDNSGSLKYVRIEFGGYVYQPNQEINGLTLGAVGRGTTIDYVQCSFINDDAFEWFAGAVNCKHLVSYRNIDDDFDTDYGFSGNVQFCLAVRDPQLADNPSVSTSEIFESDNNPTGTAATPVTSGIFSNVTAIGPLRGSTTSTVASGHRRGLRIRRNSQLKVFNSIFIDNATRGMFIDGSASETNAMNGTLKFKNNIVAGYGQRATEQGTFGIINTNTFIIANANDTLKSSANILTTPYNYTSPDYRPSPGSIALSGASFADPALAAVLSTVTPVVAAIMPNSHCIGYPTGSLTPVSFAASSTVTSGYCSLSWVVPTGVSISNPQSETPTFTISSLGTFSIQLVVTNSEGTATVTTAVTTNTCLDVSVSEHRNGISFLSIFPNPAPTFATLKLHSQAATPAEISIIDLTGKSVARMDEQLTAGENKVELLINLRNGLYFVTITTSNGKETVKLAVNH